MSIKSLSGQVFGRLTVIGVDKSRTNANPNSAAYWVCGCECGNEKSVRSDHLRQGRVRSCGCLKRHKSNGFKHGMKGTRIYRIWTSMKNRCNDKIS